MMSTATSSVTTSDPSWAAPTSQVAAPQWQSQEQYQQYYNYYQAMSQASAASTAPAATAPSAPTTATDPAAAYPQDYSKAWDEYYKAYYGQAYTVSAPATQYPATAYNYDQYGYPNLAAPPPTYQYDSVATSAAYQYPQPPAVAPVASAASTTTSAYPYTDPNYTAPPSSTWNEPPPTYEKPATYNQSYQQPSSYEKPTSFDQSRSYPSSDNNRSTTFSEPSGKTDSYMDRFPPPTFDSSNKQGPRSAPRGRGYNKGDQRVMDNRDDSFRRPPRGNRGQSNNKMSSGRGSFNDRPQYDQEDRSQYNNREQPNNFDRPPYKNNDYQNEDISFSGRGRPPYRARGGDSSFRGRGGDSSFRGRGGYEANNRRFSGSDNQSWNATDESQDHAWKSELHKPDIKKESPWDLEEESVLPGWTMGGANRKRDASMEIDKASRLPIKVAPIALMDIAVRPSGQSPIIIRRQGLIDQWQGAVRDIADRKMPIQQYWTTLKSGLVPEVQGLLCPSFVRGDNAIHCELHLDDIFLVQAKGNNEDMAIEEASKSMWQLLQTKLYVHTASRSWGTEKVPVFCVSRSVSGPVSCPPFIKGVAPTQGPGVIDGQCQAPLKPQAVNTAPPTVAVAIKTENTIATVVVAAKAPPAPPVDHSYKEDDIFLVVDPSLNEKDQAISILNNTAKFNHITIEYKHEKPPTAPHISQCLITINGQEFEKSEARDYLFAKREAADKAVVIFRDSCPQISLRFDQAEDVTREAVMKPGKSSDESLGDFLRAFVANPDEDSIHRFGAAFTNEDRDTVLKLTGNLNLCSKSEKAALLVYKQYPIEDMKRRILRQGYCAQYRLVAPSTPCKESAQ